MESSDWPSMSINPGATTMPFASMTRCPDDGASTPICAFRPCRMPISPAYHGDPVPSTMWQLRTSRSNCCASAPTVSARAITRKQKYRSIARDQYDVLHSPAFNHLLLWNIPFDLHERSGVHRGLDRAGRSFDQHSESRG